MPRRSRSFFTTTNSSVTKRQSKGDGHNEHSFKTTETNSNVSTMESPSLEKRLATMGIDLKKTRSGSEINVSSTKGMVVVEDDSSNLSGRSSAQSMNSAVSQSMSPRTFGAGLSGRRGDEGIGESTDVSERKSARLSKDISRRISEISTSMDQYDKNVRNVNETIQEAFRKSVQDQMRNKQGEGGGSPGSRLRSKNSSPRIGGDEIGDSPEAFLLKCRESLSKSILEENTLRQNLQGGAGDNPASIHGDLLFVGRESPRKIFGFDAAPILKSSSSEVTSSEDEVRHTNDVDKPTSEPDSSSDEEDRAATMRVSIESQKRPSKAATLKRLEENAKNATNRSARSKVKKKKNRRSLTGKMEDFVPRSLSPIMPSLPDKQFQTMLERREERVTRHLNSMKNSLTKLNNKVEMDKRRADDGDKTKSSNNCGGGSGSSARGNMQHSYKGRPLRLMQAQPDKELFSEFNKFMQSTGGKAGGWEGRDHNLFLKTFEIWRNHPKQLLESLRKDLPHKKPTEIANHVKWYERYLELDAKNKANVHKWSQKKRTENELVFQMSSASIRAKLEGDKRRQEHLQRIREQERERNKEKLALWKRSQYVRSASSVGSADATVEPTQPLPFQRPGRPRSTSSFLSNQEAANKPPPSSIQTPTKQKNEESGSGNFDIAGVRHHILEMTAKVHALDNPKRDFRPPPLPVLQSFPGRSGKDERRGGSGEKFDTQQSKGKESLQTVPAERSWSRNQLRMKQSVVSDMKSSVKGGAESIESSRSRPRSVDGSSRQSRKLSEFREKDVRLIEAKKKAIQIARERRTNNLNQISVEEIRRRLRSQTSHSSSTILNPTKQSELRKSLTHLKRLEILSKEDLKMGGASTQGASHPHPSHLRGYLDDNHNVQLQPPIFSSNSFPTNISNVTKKNIPSWRLLSMSHNFSPGS